ncbi:MULTISPECIES: hypothetical protein [unclassified Pseudomonas]
MDRFDALQGQVTAFEVRGWISVSDAERYASAALAGCGTACQFALPV